MTRLDVIYEGVEEEESNTDERLDSLAGRELSGGVASVSLELGRRVAPQRTGRSVV